MELGMIGLGRMGGNMARRLLRAGHRVVGYDSDPQKVQDLVQEGVKGARSLADVVDKLRPPRIVWCMLPAGEATESAIEALIPLLDKGDVIIDGGNANYKDTLRRSAHVREHGLHFVDVGTSGGIWGLTEGYCLMIGGEEIIVQQLVPIFQALAPAPDKGWGHVGPNGAGHFVKMVHNGIEYGLMQSYAEGFEILHSKKEFPLDLHQIAQIWRYGSVIRSWLLDLTAAALQEDQSLSGVKGWVADSGEGRWTVAEAIDLDVPAPILTLSLLMRLASRQEESYAAKLLAVMRKWFGGHEVRREA
nr:decarboxylating 6-phosphogluconate dehydrogenase [Chloroflexota bacterium]